LLLKDRGSDKRKCWSSKSITQCRKLLQLSSRCTIMSHVHISSYYFHCLPWASAWSRWRLRPRHGPRPRTDPLWSVLFSGLIRRTTSRSWSADSVVDGRGTGCLDSPYCKSLWCCQTGTTAAVLTSPEQVVVAMHWMVRDRHSITWLDTGLSTSVWYFTTPELFHSKKNWCCSFIPAILYTINFRFFQLFNFK